MEMTSGFVANLRLAVQSATVIRAAATATEEVGIGISGLWRYRTTNFDASHPGGGAGVYDIFVTATANNFTGGGLDPDSTTYDWSMVIIATGGTPGGVAAYRKVGECDWNGTALSGLRQLYGLGDSTAPVTPTAAQPTIDPVRIRLAAAHSARALKVESSAGAELAAIKADGTPLFPAGWLVNADVNTAAALAESKFANGASGLAKGSFSAYRAAAQSVAGFGVVVFDTEEWDVSGWYDTATGRYTPQVAGYYRLNYSVEANATIAAGKFWRGRILKSDGTYYGGAPFSQDGTLSLPLAAGSALVKANGSTDYFVVDVNHDVGGSLALHVGAGETTFQGEFVGRS